MNIFYTDNCPILAAYFLCDRHVVKMPIESAQMSATICPLPLPTKVKLGTEWQLAIFGRDYYKVTHAKHPCTVWAHENIANYAWLIAHGLHGCEAYSKRYKKLHGAYWPLCKAAYELLDRTGATTLSELYVNHTEPPQAMPDQYKVVNEPTQAYRKYIKLDKTWAKWKHSATPYWMAS